MNKQISFILGLLLFAGVGISGLTDSQSNELNSQLSLNDAIRRSFESFDYNSPEALKWLDLNKLGEALKIDDNIAQIVISIPANDVGSKPRIITLSNTDGKVVALEGENLYPMHVEVTTDKFEITFRDFEGSDVSIYTSDQFYSELAQARESIVDSHQELSEADNH